MAAVGAAVIVAAGSAYKAAGAERDAASRHAQRRQEHLAEMAKKQEKLKAQVQNPRREKCPSCGSNTFAVAHGERVCAFCRTPEGE